MAKPKKLDPAAKERRTAIMESFAAIRKQMQKQAKLIKKLEKQFGELDENPKRIKQQR